MSALDFTSFLLRKVKQLLKEAKANRLVVGHTVQVLITSTTSQIYPLPRTRKNQNRNISIESSSESLRRICAKIQSETERLSLRGKQYLEINFCILECAAISSSFFGIVSFKDSFFSVIFNLTNFRFRPYFLRTSGRGRGRTIISKMCASMMSQW